MYTPHPSMRLIRTQFSPTLFSLDSLVDCPMISRKNLLVYRCRHLNVLSLSVTNNPWVSLVAELPSIAPIQYLLGVIWGFGTATACITSGVVLPHAILSIMHAFAVSVVKDNLPNPISFHAEPQLWPVTSLLHP